MHEDYVAVITRRQGPGGRYWEYVIYNVNGVKVAGGAGSQTKAEAVQHAIAATKRYQALVCGCPECRKVVQ